MAILGKPGTFQYQTVCLMECWLVFLNGGNKDISGYPLPIGSCFIVSSSESKLV